MRTSLPLWCWRTLLPFPPSISTASFSITNTYGEKRGRSNNKRQRTVKTFMLNSKENYQYLWENLDFLVSRCLVLWSLFLPDEFPHPYSAALAEPCPCHTEETHSIANHKTFGGWMESKKISPGWIHGVTSRVRLASLNFLKLTLSRSLSCWRLLIWKSTKVFWNFCTASYCSI